MSVLADRLKCLLESGYPDQKLVRVELPVGRVESPGMAVGSVTSGAFFLG